VQNFIPLTHRRTKMELHTICEWSSSCWLQKQYRPIFEINFDFGSLWWAYTQENKIDLSKQFSVLIEKAYY